MLAAGVFEWTQHQGSATAVLQVAWQVLPSHSAHTTLVGTGHRQPRALILVALDGVKHELLGAVGARLGALGALRGGMLGQQSPHHASTTLVLTVHTLLGAHALVVLKGLPTEVTATKFALEAPLGAIVLQVCRQVPATQLGGAAIGARDNIEAASVQVALEMAKGPTPAAALFTVDAADRQAQHLYLQLWVWVDLGIV